MAPKNSWKMPFHLFSCQLLFQVSGSLASWCMNISYCTRAVQLLCKGVHACTVRLHYLARYDSSVFITYVHQLCETTEALSQHWSGSPSSLWQLPAGPLSHAFSNWGQITFEPSSSASLFIQFRDLRTLTSSFSVTAMLWCTAYRGMWAIPVWGRCWWYRTLAGWLIQPRQRLPPCCKAGRSKHSWAPSLSSPVVWLIFADSLRICSGGVEVCAHN